jgi:hypothetical protein
MNYTTLIISLIFVIIVTFILKLFDNKSGTATYFILPSAIAAITIYLIGGWDLKKPNWCPIDILTWISIFVLAFVICIIPIPKSKHSFGSPQPQPLHQPPLPHSSLHQPLHQHNSFLHS